MSNKANHKVNPNDLTYIEAGVLLGINESTVGDLVRRNVLTRPISVDQLREYAETRKAGRSKGGARWFHVKMTPEQFEAFEAEGVYEEYRDPAAAEREAAERRRSDAEKRLSGVTL